MNNKITIATRDKLLAELDDLKSNQRHEIAEKIKEARSFGDLSENSEYDEAKNEQARLEARISELEDMLANAVIIAEGSISTDIVDVGCRVKVLDQEYDEEMEFCIVGSAEAEPSSNKISDKSPIGLALLRKKVGDVAEFETPGGTMKLKVLEIGLAK